jgi:hypothetical protein
LRLDLDYLTLEPCRQSGAGKDYSGHTGRLQKPLLVWRQAVHLLFKEVSNALGYPHLDCGDICRHPPPSCPLHDHALRHQRIDHVSDEKRLAFRTLV